MGGSEPTGRHKSMKPFACHFGMRRKSRLFEYATIPQASSRRERLV